MAMPKQALTDSAQPFYSFTKFGIPNSVLQPLTNAPSLIDQAYRQVLEAIADGTLAPGQRLRQAELADSFGVSRQPISHALHLLKRQGLVEHHGRKGLRVVPLDPLRVRQLYQVREVVDGLAARLAALQVTTAAADAAVIAGLRELVANGAGFEAATPIPTLVRADTAFHRGIYKLAGNPTIEEMTAPLWPQLMRSMAAVLRDPGYAARVWRQEHAAILLHVLAGDATLAEAAAKAHAATAASLTALHFDVAHKAA